MPIMYDSNANITALNNLHFFSLKRLIHAPILAVADKKQRITDITVGTQLTNKRNGFIIPPVRNNI